MNRWGIDRAESPQTHPPKSASFKGFQAKNLALPNHHLSSRQIGSMAPASTGLGPIMNNDPQESEDAGPQHGMQSSPQS